jgi:hypothetical protein
VVTSSGQTLQAQAFTDSLAWIAEPEDPNFDYTAGHYVPFPLTILTLQAEKHIAIEIHLLP